MAIAKQQPGVTRGYRTKAQRAMPRKPTMVRRIVMSLRQGARELHEFVTDELVYATIDTVRILNFLRWELGFRTRARVEPVVHELEHFVHDHETLNSEQVRALAKR